MADITCSTVSSMAHSCVDLLVPCPAMPCHAMRPPPCFVRRRQLSQLTEEQAVEAIEEFASCDMSRIRNKRYVQYSAVQYSTAVR